MIGYLLKIKLKTYLYALLLACTSFLIIYEVRMNIMLYKLIYNNHFLVKSTS